MQEVRRLPEGPVILVYTCNWCSYTSADLAGVNRLTYPENVRIIRFMCSGRVEPDFILRALENGADGVVVSGCRLGECHYLKGNYHAKDRIERVRELLHLLGVEPERVRGLWLSAAEGRKFSETMNEFYSELSRMGESPLKRGEDPIRNMPQEVVN